LGIGFATGLVALVAAAPQSPTSQTQPPATPPATPPVTAPPTTPPPATAPPAAPAPTPQPPTAEPQAAGPPVPRTFTSDAGIIFSAIKPEKATDFEAVMARVKDALAKSSNPRRKQQAAAWRVFKSVEPGPGRSILYLSFFDPPVKDEEYSVSTILSEAFPEEAQALWRRYIDCFVDGQTLVNLKLAVAMSATAAAK
jgi:hypothetical protein